MRISLELDQSWNTAKELREYLGKLERTLQRICEMEAESPTNWFLRCAQSILKTRNGKSN